MKTNTLTLDQMTTAKGMIGSEINDMEYIDHIVKENDNTYFQIVHLNGNERLIKVTDLIK